MEGLAHLVVKEALRKCYSIDIASRVELQQQLNKIKKCGGSNPAQLFERLKNPIQIQYLEPRHQISKECGSRGISRHSGHEMPHLRSGFKLKWLSISD
jgi:hypothetical protein